MSKENLNSKVEEKKVNVANNDLVENEALEFLREESIREDFFNFSISRKVTGVRFNNEDNTKLTVQTKVIDPITKDLISESFGLTNDNGWTKEEVKNKLINKWVKVDKVEENMRIVRDTRTKQVQSRTYTYGANYKNLKVLDKELEVPFSINKYCKIELCSVAPVLKRQKETGNVKLISLVLDEDTFEQKEFSCILEAEKGLKYSVDKFDKLLGKEIFISEIVTKYNDIKGEKTHYTNRVPKIDLK